MEKMVLEYQQRSHQSFIPLPFPPNQNYRLDQYQSYYLLQSTWLKGYSFDSKCASLNTVTFVWDDLQISFPPQRKGFYCTWSLPCHLPPTWNPVGRITSEITIKVLSEANFLFTSICSHPLETLTSPKSLKEWRLQGTQSSLEAR